MHIIGKIYRKWQSDHKYQKKFDVYILENYKKFTIEELIEERKCWIYKDILDVIDKTLKHKMKERMFEIWAKT